MEPTSYNKEFGGRDELHRSKLCIIMCLPSIKAAPVYASHYFYIVIMAKHYPIVHMPALTHILLFVQLEWFM